jgi:hypothetical protein
MPVPRLTLNLANAVRRRGLTFAQLVEMLSAENGCPHPLSYNAIYRLSREQPSQIGLNTLARLQWAIAELTGDKIPDSELWTYSEDE